MRTRTTILAFIACAAPALAAENIPPPGFTALFNGKDLSGWYGWGTRDPVEFWAMTPEQQAEYKRQSIEGGLPEGKRGPEHIRAHWRVEGGELVNDGKGLYLTTDKDYRDFDLWVQYKALPDGDSGVYLRGTPQVQIWDSTKGDPKGNGQDKGSGGLWNNSPGTPGKDPLVLADKPFGEWNSFRILMVGSRVSVWLNNKLVVDHALMENYYDRKVPIPARGPIQLQTHGGEIRWRNIYVREIGAAEANEILSRKGNAGFQPIFNGCDLTGWAGPTDNYEVKDSAIVCKPGKGGTIYTKEEYADFAVRLEFRLPKGGNNGLAIRYPGQGDAAYAGMTEIQVLDENYEQATGSTIDARQAHGSVYGMIAAHRGYQRPIGEWNFEEVTVKGSRIKVELNGVVILDGDVATVKELMHNSPHPGKDRTKGHFGFAGHNDPVCFRNVLIKTLD